jgi:hypothetical protein
MEEIVHKTTVPRFSENRNTDDSFFDSIKIQEVHQDTVAE